ncbi:MAG: DSBA oxidoreductase family protein [Candidatus Uhrbacteria bacterium GW2011_GWE2_40_58]|nr:MAG: DSBA oxidoreductase family protein [Candidatus Uhrbacteria bacterium GW2011_GWF2_40_263]KKR68169.1 MAG: DSBA oxidoreductase family protein [Candidatus Uhrbacteria bacterium GW2011_GWE2_40_58]OGL91857.1 MAG: hypothetical protein A2239_01550 [Candidatus Uhrbacteria bacterium RIFOXYA2_FULL_40_9]OGL97675.1 MAG: hypothetical protein A2332_00800 [Candidatus Uhrbacteria bacterium RIFOXYB2_FULL_41_18]HBK34666.1 hypothetical protein [Candidatus Uhrbacteria bacterium]
MKHLWLSFLVIGGLAFLVVIIFFYQSRPINLEMYFEQTEVEAIEQPTVTFVNPSKGAEEATVTFIVFSDFDCTACKQLANSLDIVLSAYPDSVRIVWKDMPQESMDGIATAAAIAAHCAQKQNRFWEYHDALFTRQSYLSEDQFLQIATDLGMDSERFTSCYATQDTLAIVTRDYEEGLGLNLIAAPTLFLNGESHVGAISTQDLLTVVQQSLTQH